MPDKRIQNCMELIQIMHYKGAIKNEMSKMWWVRKNKGNRILCPTCGGSGKVKQTNEEWFDALPTEGKAKWLDGLIAYCFGVGHRTETEQKKYQHIVADVEVWLKQPHREEWQDA